MRKLFFHFIVVPIAFLLLGSYAFCEHIIVTSETLDEDDVQYYIEAYLKTKNSEYQKYHRLDLIYGIYQSPKRAQIFFRYSYYQKNKRYYGNSEILLVRLNSGKWFHQESYQYLTKLPPVSEVDKQRLTDLAQEWFRLLNGEISFDRDNVSQIVHYQDSMKATDLDVKYLTEQFKQISLDEARVVKILPTEDENLAILSLEITANGKKRSELTQACKKSGIWYLYCNIPHQLPELTLQTAEELINKLNNFINDGDYESVRKIIRPEGKKLSTTEWAEYVEGWRTWYEAAGKVIESKIISSDIKKDHGQFTVETVYEKIAGQKEKIEIHYIDDSFYITFLK
jgi:hypothetical protein